MNFEMPNAAAGMNNAVAAVGDTGECWDVIGTPLDEGVDKTVPGYDAKLELNLNPKSGAKREEVCCLHWGRIDKDVARLNGLAAAIDNISAVIKKGKDQLAHDWKGKSFDAFRAAVERVEKTLNDYSAAVKTTAKGLGTATAGIRTQYNSYRDNSTRILAFDNLAKPNDWRKVTEGDCEHFADVCPTNHFGTGFGECTKDNSEQEGIIVGKHITQARYDLVSGWRCNENAGLVISQYRDIVKWSNDEKSAIEGKIHEWYVATDQLKTGVGNAYRAALENLRIIAELKVFSTMTVPGTAGGSGGTDPDDHRGNGNPNPGNGNPNPGGGGGSSSPPPGGGGDSTPPAGTDQPAQPSPGQPSTEDDPGATKPETVEIKDGDRTIGVQSPDGQGHVKVTVDDGTGKPKSYDLDFGDPTRTTPGTGQPPAGGGAPPAGTPDSGAGQPAGSTPVQAGQDGKCVIKDGPLTITAEHPPGSADTVMVTVDNGAGAPPTTYTLDYADPANPQVDHGTPGQPAGQVVGAGQPAPDGAVGRHAQPEPPVAPGQAVPISAPADAGAGPGTPAGPGQAVPGGYETQVSQPDQQVPAGSDPLVARTEAQGSAGGSGYVASDDSGGWGAPGAAALGQFEAHQPGGPGEAGLATADDGGSTAPADHSQQGMAGGGMPMMGGMGGGSGGGDTGRAGSAWRIHGDLFDDGEAHLAGAVGEDER
jgi:uncharacterized protein YukE